MVAKSRLAFFRPLGFAGIFPAVGFQYNLHNRPEVGIYMKIIHAITFFVIIGVTSLVQASVQPTPGESMFTSENHHFLFHLLPLSYDELGVFRGALWVFDEKNGRYERLWPRELQVEHGPRSREILVSNEGFVIDIVSFVGIGDSVITIYAVGGKVEHEFKLRDLFSEAEIARLGKIYGEHSMDWRQGASYGGMGMCRIDNNTKTLIIPMITAVEKGKPIYRDVHIQFTTGTIVNENK